MKRDICVKIEEGKFNYRVGAIIINQNKVLMVKNADSAFFYTVGGRVRLGETVHEAVLREAYEETRLNFEIERLAFIHENFFVMDSEGEFYHEVSLFFLMKPHDLAGEIDTALPFEEEYGSATLHWLPIDGLADLHLYPEFFKTELVTPFGGVRHFVTRDEVTIAV